MRFINAINESGYFVQLEGKLPYQVLYDHLDENVTGVVITPFLKKKKVLASARTPMCIILKNWRTNNGRNN